MLDLFAIFTKGGIVLWSYKEGTVSGNPVSDLVRSILIEEHSGDKSTHTFKTHGVQYELDNEFNLVFAAVYLKQLESHLKYIPGLLKRVRATFVKEFKGQLSKDPYQNYSSFEPAFQILRKSEQDKAKEQTTSMKSFEESKKFQTTLQHNQELQSGQKATKAAEKQKELEQEKLAEKDDEAEEARRIKEILAKRGKRGGRATKKPGKTSSAPSSANTTPKKKYTKPPSEKVKIDYSDPNAQAPEDDYVPDLSNYTRTESGEVPEMDYDSDNSWEVVDEADADGKEAAATGGVFSFFKGLTGQTTITKEALEPVLEKMKEHLISKNVASEIAGKLCESVGQSLEGRSKGTFSGVTSIVKESVQETLTRILSPNRRLDILRDIMAANEKGNPYSVVFCGVNGVGKSTNLAKICFWLMENNNRVLIAACDTFRAGAVEQLKTHCKKLNAIHKSSDNEPKAVLFEKGYGKDDAGIAKDAITFAKDNGFNVVLVDTAGRMQGNERLMRSLAKLVKVNDPNLVLFVGEALVGNEAVDQLSKFNQALGDYSESNTPRLIDGVVLTKFDTIDDKVGAAISMTYTCGQPIVFVGTGQEYHDLKKLNVKSVVQSLLK